MIRQTMFKAGLFPALSLAPVLALVSALILPLVLGLSAAQAAGGLHPAAGPAAAKYQNVVAVAKSGAPYSTVSTALASISDASADNRYLVTVGPGVYNENIQLRPWVDVTGSGRDATVITWTGGDTPSTATVTGADNSQLSNLSVVNTGGGNYALGIYNTVASPRLRDLDISVTNNTGIVTAGIYNNSDASPQISDLNINLTASGTVDTVSGIYNFSSSSPRINDTKLTVSSSAVSTRLYGVHNEVSCAPQITNLDLSLTSSGGSATYLRGVFNTTGCPARIFQSRITVNGGTNPATGLYNESSATHVTNCSIQVSADAGTSSDGVYNSSSDEAVFRHVAITVSAATSANCVGLMNLGSSCLLSNLAVHTSGSAGNNYGIFNSNSSPNIQYCTITGDGTEGAGIGIANSATSRPAIAFCTVQGETAIANQSGTTNANPIRVLQSTLNGSVESVNNTSEYTTTLTGCIVQGTVNVTGGTVNCGDCYDESGGTVTCP